MPRRSFTDSAGLDSLLSGQQNCATLAQLAALGLSSSTIAYRTRPAGGTWQRILPGVVLAHRGTPSQAERLVAATLYAGPASVVTGTEALRRTGFRNLPPAGDVHLLVPPSRQRGSARYVLIERTDADFRRHTVGGVTFAAADRALVDHVRRVQQLDAVRAVTAEALQRRLLRPDALVAAVLGAQRQGTARVRVALQEVLDGVRSVEEARARSLILGAGLRPPLWNVDLVTADGRFLARPDGWWEDGGVALEVNSREHHLDPQSWEATQRRWRRMAQLGITLVPITPAAMRSDPATFLAQLAQTLHATRGRRVEAVRVVRRERVA